MPKIYHPCAHCAVEIIYGSIWFQLLIKIRVLTNCGSACNAPSFFSLKNPSPVHTVVIISCKGDQIPNKSQKVTLIEPWNGQKWPIFQGKLDGKGYQFWMVWGHLKSLFRHLCDHCALVGHAVKYFLPCHAQTPYSLQMGSRQKKPSLVNIKCQKKPRALWLEILTIFEKSRPWNETEIEFRDFFQGRTLLF